MRTRSNGTNSFSSAWGIGVAMIVNIYAAGKVDEVGVWFFVRFFIGGCSGNPRRLCGSAGPRILLSHQGERQASEVEIHAKNKSRYRQQDASPS